MNLINLKLKNCIFNVSYLKVFRSLEKSPVFSIMGFLAYELDAPVSHAVRDGLGLAFIAYPDVTLQLPG